MTRFVLDSNLYIEAARDPTKASALAEFALGSLPRILLHAVVVQEMLAGAVSESARRESIEIWSDRSSAGGAC